jgi:serine/threonine-protein kinase
MMEVILQVEQGPEQGREFHFAEADNLLVGRKDPTSHAHWELSPEDRQVSRDHFIIEVRPPNCMIRDVGSTNGTYVRRQGQGQWERIEETLVAEGDQIKVGQTILGVKVALPPPQEVRAELGQGVRTELVQGPVEAAAAPEISPLQPSPTPGPPQAGPEPELRCIRCGEPLERLPDLTGSNLRDLDFMCANCRAQVEASRAHQAAAQAAERYTCQRCDKDVTGAANGDGRAAELAEAALYLCPACAEQERRLRSPDIGGYLLLGELGRGGMGVVYQAWQRQTGRVVALKLMLPFKADPRLRLRFLREMSIMQELQHAHLVRLLEAGQHGDAPFFISEFIADGDLARYVPADGRPTLPPPEVAQLIAAALLGLSHFHQLGYVHRDLKPENILLKRSQGLAVPKLADFGLARSYERHGGTVTRTGESAGTVMYMPLEQILDFKKAKPSVDIYAMGVSLYYLLSGRFPLDFPAFWQIRQGRGQVKKDPMRMILEDKPQSIQRWRRDLSPALAQVVDRAVQKQPGDRYPSAEAFRTALLQAIET